MPAKGTISSEILGGVFALPTVLPSRYTEVERPFPFQVQPAHYLVNARSAFWVLATALQPRRIWLPSYLCGSVCEAFAAANRPATFFPVDRGLRCADSTWTAQIAPGDFVLRIHYFGFLNRDPVFLAARARGAILVDDAAQALLTRGIGADSDFAVFSPRKFIGVPDGSILLSRTREGFTVPALRPPPPNWWLGSLAANQRRRDFDRGLPDRTWFPLFQESEKNAPTGPFAMAELTRLLLDSAFDFEAIAVARRKNYQHLCGLLGSIALFPELPADCVPLGFPVTLSNRDEVRRQLFSKSIFPPIHWPITDVVPPAFHESHRLAREIMTLPCDQRYSPHEIDRVVESFLAVLERK